MVNICGIISRLVLFIVGIIGVDILVPFELRPYGIYGLPDAICLHFYYMIFTCIYVFIMYKRLYLFKCKIGKEIVSYRLLICLLYVAPFLYIFFVSGFIVHGFLMLAFDLLNDAVKQFGLFHGGFFCIIFVALAIIASLFQMSSPNMWQLGVILCMMLYLLLRPTFHWISQFQLRGYSAK